MAKSATDLFARFCAEHNIYAVVSFVQGITIDNIGDDDMTDAMSSPLGSAPSNVIKALAVGCEQQSMRLDGYETNRQTECGQAIETAKWFNQ